MISKPSFSSKLCDFVMNYLGLYICSIVWNVTITLNHFSLNSDSSKEVEIILRPNVFSEYNLGKGKGSIPVASQPLSCAVFKKTPT